jgi:hypothetical protein
LAIGSDLFNFFSHLRGVLSSGTEEEECFLGFFLGLKNGQAVVE